jgi:hypothetical protein
MPETAEKLKRSFVADFFPGSFALVMATGIVSIALHSAGMRLLSNLLFGINIFSFFVLSGITILRLWRYRAAFVQDLTQLEVINPLPRNKRRRQKLDAKSQAIPATRLPQRLANEGPALKQADAKIASAEERYYGCLISKS